MAVLDLKKLDVLKNVSTAISLFASSGYCSRVEDILERASLAMKLLKRYLGNEKDLKEIEKLYGLIQEYANSAKVYAGKTDLISEARYKEYTDLSRHVCKKIAEKLWELRRRIEEEVIIKNCRRC